MQKDSVCIIRLIRCFTTTRWTIQLLKKILQFTTVKNNISLLYNKHTFPFWHVQCSGLIITVDGWKKNMLLLSRQWDVFWRLNLTCFSSEGLWCGRLQCYFCSGLVFFIKFCVLYVLTQLSISGKKKKKSCVTFVLPPCCIRTSSTPSCVRNNGIDVDLWGLGS